MNTKLLCGLSSAFLPMGLYAAVAQSSLSYQRRAISALVAEAGRLDNPIQQPGQFALKRPDIRPVNEWVQGLANNNLGATGLEVSLDEPSSLAIVQSTPIRELLVIDEAVPNKETFYRYVKPGIAIVEINSSHAGLPQLITILQHYKQLSAVHIVSHAQEGVLLLGNSHITAESFKAEIKAFAAINDAMQDNADLLFYGCNLAANKAGEDILAVIKNNTHVDVAASNNNTGAGALGGDWQLEIQQGRVDTGLPFSERALKDFKAVLGSYSPRNFCNASNGGKYRTNITTISSQDGAYKVTANPASFNCGYSGTLGYATGNHSIYLTKPSGGTFKLTAISLGGGCTTVSAYAKNSTTTTASSLNNTTASYNNYILMTNLTGVSMDKLQLKLTGCTGQMGLSAFSVPDPNSAPTNISLSASSVNQSASANATVGTLSSTDPDSGNTFTYTLVSGTGSTNNASFTISGSSLKVISPSTMAAGTYSVRVRTTDQGSATFEKAFTITVVDNVPPTVSSVNASTANGSYKTGDTVSVQVNFSEAVTVTGTPQLTLETGATDRVVNYSSGSGTSSLTFTYTVQAGDTSADLDYLSTAALALNGGTIRDAASNNATLTLAAPGAANSLGNNKALVIDGVAPTVSSVGSSTSNGTYKTGDTISLQVNFSEAVSVTGTPQLTLETSATDRLVNYTSGSGTSTLTFAYTVQAGDTSADLDYISTSALTLNGGTILDATGNVANLTLASPGAANSLSNSKALVVDTTGPTATLVVADTALAIGQTSLVTITFSEAVTGFTNANLTITNGTLSSVSSSDGGITWTATFTPTASISDATNLITLNNTGVTDSAGNAGTGSTDSNNYAIDSVRPTATIAVADSSLTAGETSLVTITFSEAVTGFTNADLSIANGTLSAVSSADGGITWTATLTPSTDVSNATNLITLDNSGVADTAGNAGSGTSSSNNYSVATLRPTATLVIADTALSAGETSLVTITFSLPVTGFTNADLTIAGGSLSTVSSVDGGTTWTATFTPTASTTSSSNTITLDNTGVSDEGGNTGTGTTQSNTYAIDTQRPTATLVMADNSLTSGETGLVTITFSEAVTGFTNADLSVAGGTLSTVSSSDGGITWSATFTPNASLSSASNLISLDNTGIADAAGNAGSGTTNSNAYAIDTQRPTATLTLANSALKIGDTSLVTITFSEAVSGFTNADLSVANGTLSSVASIDGGITWTATFTPTASITNATNLVTLDNTGVEDALGNAGSGTTSSNNYSVDTLRPTATLVVADNALAIGETSLVTITFSEAVSGFSNADLSVAGGTLSAVSSSDGGVTWTATFTPSASSSSTGNLISLDNTGVADAAGNSGSGSSNSNPFAIDGERPTATLVMSDSTLTAGETSLVTITFSEAVSGFTNADLTVAGGSLSAVSSTDGGVTWTATFTPNTNSNSADNVITLDATGITDIAGNAGTGSTSTSAFAVDTVRPTATLAMASSSLKAGETSLLTITFSRAVTGFANADLTVPGGSLSTVNSNDGGITWTATFTPTANFTAASNAIVLDNTGVTDSAGNTGTSTTGSNSYAIDTQRPTATLVVADNSLTIGETSLVSITFSEAVTGFSNADLTLGNGTLSAVSSSDGGITWTATFTPTAGIINANNVISLDTTGVVDAAGNSGSGSVNSNTYAVNNTPPGVSLVMANTALRSGDTSLITITFTHAVTGFTNADLTIAGGTLSAVSSSDGGITWTATFTPTAGITLSNVVIQLDNTGVSDTFGNPGSGSISSNSFAIDTQLPTATLVVADTTLSAGETSLVTITFSEAVSGFTQADLSVVNGTLSGLASADGGITWTANFTPTADTVNATNLITLDASGVSDSAGNPGTGSVASNNFAIDTQRPTASLVVADTSLTLGETSLVTITFSRAVSGFNNGDLTLANGSLSAVTSNDGGITWTANFTPSAGVTSTPANISLDNSGVTDAAGNTGTGITASNSFAIDTQRPTAAISFSDSALAIGETSLVTITFSEAITGLTNAAIAVSNGTLNTLSSSDGGVTWTATFTPTASISAATNVLMLDISGVQDLAGNAGSGSSQSANFAIDSTRPSLQTGITVSDTALKAGDTASVTFTFSEAVTGFTLANITAASGTLSNLSSTDGGITWTATLTPAAGTEVASNLISLNLATITDLAGNTGAGINTSSNYTVDTRTPSFASPISLSDTALKQGESATVTFVFNEAVSGFSLAAVTSQGGTLSNLSSSDGGITWTATFTPSANENSIGNHISVDLTGVTDSAGNAGSGSSASPSFAVDTQLPSLIGPIAISDTSLTQGESATLTFTFSEPVSGFTLAAITAPNGTITNLVTSDGGTTWTATFTPSADTTAAANTLSLNLASITDLAGNAGSGNASSPSFAVDTQAPTQGAVITLADNALRMGETSAITLSFSEPVKGLTLSGIKAPNGVLSALTSSDGGLTWIALFTPNAGVTAPTNAISIDNTSFTDVAGNIGSGSSVSANYAIDTQLPTASISLAPATVQAGTTAVLTITFSEAITGLTAEDLILPSGSLSGLTSTDGGITWQGLFTPSDNTSAQSNQIRLDNSGIQDLAGNTGTGTTPSANYTVDTARPSLISIVLADTTLQTGKTTLVTFSFSEAISGFTVDDLQVPGGSLSNLSSSDGGITWTATFTPNANSSSSGNQISLNMSGIADAAGNAGVGSLASNAFNVDTSNPTQPLVATPTAQVFTNKTTQLIQGSHAENGVRVKVYVDADNNGQPDSDTPIGSSLVSDGLWSLTVPLQQNSDNHFLAIAEDTAGNLAQARVIPTITQDAIAPLVPTGTDLADASDSGLSNSDNITNISTPSLGGRAEPSATITVTSDLDGLVGMVQADALGNWSLSLDPLSTGAHQLSIAAADAAGNISLESAPLAITIDTSAPALSPIAAQRLALGASTALLPFSLSDNLSDIASVQVQGRSSNTTAVPLVNIVVSGSGKSRGVTVTAAAAGSATISLEATDVAGNHASISFNLLANTLPTIAGTPSSVITANNSYRFAPVVQDADANTLSFSITNLPKWASFNSITGVLSGTPSGADLGTSGDIVISVNDGIDTVSLPSFSIAVQPPSDAGLPVLTVPAAVQVNATGLFTPITLQQLLGLANTASQGAVDSTLAGLAVDSLHSDQCCTLRPNGLNEQGRLVLPPGLHTVVWKATNTKGQSVEGTQVLELRPLVSFSKSQEALRGSLVNVRVLLNGPSPRYPLEVPYSIDASSTAGVGEYLLTDGVVTFTTENPLEVIIPVNLLDIKGLANSKLVLNLGDSTINLGVNRTHTISLLEGNVAPTVQLKLQQNGISTSQITPDGGPVTATAEVKDVNIGDTHSFDWSASDSELIDTDGKPTDGSVLFNPQALNGVHHLRVTVTDSAGASAKTQLNFPVVRALPILDPLKDSDSDGISDADEGLGDTNGNNIPDYLDNVASNNLLPQVGAITQAYLLECDPGLRCGLGEFVLAGSTGGAQILDNEVAQLKGLKTDNQFTPVGGIFDFVANDLPLAGQTLRIVIPQKAAIPTGAVYRKFDNGSWRTFVENANNALHSTQGSPGFCPPPGDDSWQSGLKPGYYCVQLTLEDGGPNDTDGLVNSAIADPGYVGVVKAIDPPPAPVQNITSKGKKRGGAIDTSLLALLGLLTAARSRKGRAATARLAKRLAASGLLIAASNHTRAEAAPMEDSWYTDTYVRASWIKVSSGESQSDFNQALTATSATFTLQRYDTDRSGWQFAFGKQLNEHWAVELGYLDLGDVSIDFASALETPAATQSALQNHYPHASGGWTLAGAYRYELAPKVQALGRLGVYNWKGRVDISVPSIAPPEDSGTDLFAGLELSYALTSQLSLGVSFERILVSDKVDILGLDVKWGF